MRLAVPSILITDDDRDFRETLRGVLEPRGFRTLQAGDGEEALKIVSREQVHVVLLDMHMPRLDGLGLIRQVKQRLPALPIIVMTGRLEAGEQEQIQAQNIAAIVEKPFSSETILAALR